MAVFLYEMEIEYETNHSKDIAKYPRITYSKTAHWQGATRTKLQKMVMFLARNPQISMHCRCSEELEGVVHCRDASSRIYLGTLWKVFGRIKGSSRVQFSPASAETMVATHLATFAHVETKLRSSLAANDAPGAAPSEVLMTKIVAFSAKYQEILNSSRKEWASNVERLKAIFNWGFSLGELIRLCDNDPKEGKRIMGQATDLRDTLKKYYEGKKAALKDGQIKKEFEMIPEESDAIVQELLQLHIRLDLAKTKDFGNVYNKYNVRNDIEKIAEAFPTAELKKEQVTATATFFVNHLAIFVMFRNGLLQGVEGKTATKDQVMIAELVTLTKIVGKAFQDIENIITN